MVLGSLCLPGDDAFRLTTIVLGLAVDNPSADPRYGVANLLLDDPSYTVRASGASMAVTIPLGVDVTLVRASVHTTNATTASITSGAGLNAPIVIPDLDSDGQRLGGSVDLSEETGTTDDQFVVNLSRVSGIVEVGRISLWTAARDVNWESGRDEGIDRPGDVAIPTRLGVILHAPQEIRVRWWDMAFRLLEDAAMWRELTRSSKGPLFAFPLIPDVTINDCAWVHNPDPYTERREDPFVNIPRRFRELVQGPPNG